MNHYTVRNMSASKKYIIGNVATIEFKITEENEDILKTRFSYKMVLINGHSQLSESQRNKIATLIFLSQNQDSQIVYSQDIADSLSSNHRCNITDGVYNISQTAVNNVFRKLGEPWNELVSHPENSNTGWIIKDISIFDSIEDYKEKSDQSKKRITRETIKTIGEKWYKETKSRGNRFEKLLPKREILPLARKTPKRDSFPLAGNLPIYGRVNKQEDQHLLDVIESTSSHLYLIGEGGIGKTTSLYCIMEDAYQTKKHCKQIPLFIELSRAFKSSDFDFENGSFFIRNTILKRIQEFCDDQTIELECVEKLFCKKNTVPEYAFLLDGLNEVPRGKIYRKSRIEETDGKEIIDMIVGEISYIMSQYSNVRVILTSRSIENFGSRATVFFLSGIKKQNILDYLEDKLTKEQIQKTAKNERLMEVLRLPLFLTLFAHIREKGDLISRGEILNAFFSQTRNDFYTERNRANRIRDEHLNETGTDELGTSITPSMLSYILDFIIPEIAWDMMQKGKFQISFPEIADKISLLFPEEKEKNEAPFCDLYSVSCFREYPNYPRETTRTIANKIESAFCEGRKSEKQRILNITTNICACLTNRLGIFWINNDGDYNVIHQHIRDYFAARYHINKLKLSVFAYESGDCSFARETLCEWHDLPLPSQVLVFIGEVLGETHNAPVFDNSTKTWSHVVPDSSFERCDRNLIQRGLYVYKNTSIVENNLKYEVWNLFQILKLVRIDLSDVDLSYLDLSRCKANGYRMGNSDFAATMIGTVLTDDFFIPFGHTDDINSAQFSEDGKLIVTASRDHTAKVWSTATNEGIFNGTLVGHTDNVNSAQFNEDGKLIVTASDDGTARVWSTESFNVVDGGVLDCLGERVKTARFCKCKDKDYIATVSGEVFSSEDCIMIWDANTYRESSTIHLGSYGAKVADFRFSNDGERLIIVFCNGRVIELNTENYDDVIKSGVLGDCISNYTSVDFNVDNDCLITTSTNGIVKIWNMDNYEEACNETPRLRRSVSARFSRDGEYIAIVSNNGSVGIWHTKRFKGWPDGVLKYKSKTETKVQFSKDRKRILTVYPYDCLVKLWDTNTCNEVTNGTLRGYKRGFITASFSIDDEYILTLSADGSIKFWDSNSFTIVPNGIINHEKCDSFVFSKDGQYLLTMAEEEDVKIWNVESIREVKCSYLDENEIKQIKSSGEKCFFIKRQKLNKEQELIRLFCTESEKEVCEFLIEDYSKNTRMLINKKHNRFIKVDNGMVFVYEANELQNTIKNEQEIYDKVSRVEYLTDYAREESLKQARNTISDTWSSLFSKAKVLHIIRDMPGLEICNLDLRNTKTHFNDELIEYLKAYGAKVKNKPVDSERTSEFSTKKSRDR